METKPHRKGFTMIELALSMVFVGILSLAIALIIRDTIASYRRGLTLNQINTVGMDIVDDIRAAVQNAQSKSLLNDCLKYYYNNTDNNAALNACQDDQGYNFVYWVKKEQVILHEGTPDRVQMDDVPVYGAFCTGTYSYIWNSGYFETDDASFASKSGGGAKLTFMMSGPSGNQKVRIMGSLRNVNITNAVSAAGATSTPIDVGNTSKPFRLLKVRDDSRGVCAGVIRNTTGGTSAFGTAYSEMNGDLDNSTPSGFGGMFDMSDYIPVDPKEPPIDIIMTDKTYDLAIYDLFAARPAISSTQKNMFYSASFILGTVNGGINVLAHGKSCATPAEYAIENYDYCSINKFSFAAQSGIE